MTTSSVLSRAMLDAAANGHVPRHSPIVFVFEGVEYPNLADMTVASENPPEGGEWARKARETLRRTKPENGKNR